MDNRARRVSIYDAFVGFRFAEGRAGLRVGQMWLNDLGGLGSVGGVSLDVRQPSRSGAGRWRAGLFAGLEPKILEAGYVEDVLKTGALVAYDGSGTRRHISGFVHVRDRGRTERSVLVTTNFLPVNKELFVYQSAEYDVAGPGSRAGARSRTSSPTPVTRRRAASSCRAPTTAAGRSTRGRSCAISSTGGR